MAKINIRELKAHLSAIVERVEGGETIVVSKHNEPVAELRPIARRSDARVLGKPVKGLHVGREFFDPLPDEIVRAFDTDSTE